MNELKNLNYGRILILEKFGELINKVQLNKKLNIAVVGGSENEPEIIFLKKLNYQLEVKTFGIENNDFFLDLNKNDNEIPDINFDLVLCGQVLEHVWNTNSFVNNLSLLVSENTFLFVHCPKSNIHHGHTFYSSGYSEEFLLKIFSITDLNVFESGELGTPRLYTSIHLIKDWLNTEEIQNSKLNHKTWFSYLWNLNNKKPRMNKAYAKIKYLVSFRRVILSYILKNLNNESTEDKLIKTETYIFMHNL
jgi:hypothetical protein